MGRQEIKHFIEYFTSIRIYNLKAKVLCLFDLFSWKDADFENLDSQGGTEKQISFQMFIPKFNTPLGILFLKFL